MNRKDRNQLNNPIEKILKNDIKYDIALSTEQKNAKSEILNHTVSFLHGKAGSGKTIVAVAIALDLFFKKQKKKIIITRPTVGTEDNGFLPGSFQEKLDPWLVPIRDNLRKVYNHLDKLQKMESDHDIEIVALTHFRGRTFDDAVCIIDEYQNLTVEQLKMCIGRLGKNSIMLFCGDCNQIDLKASKLSATQCSQKLNKSKFVTIIELKENHRHECIDELLNLLK